MGDCLSCLSYLISLFFFHINHQHMYYIICQPSNQHQIHATIYIYDDKSPYSPTLDLRDEMNKVRDQDNSAQCVAYSVCAIKE